MKLRAVLVLFLSTVLVFQCTKSPTEPEKEPPAQPQGVSAGNATESAVTVQWPAVDEALTYAIYRSADSDGTFDSIAVVSDTSFADSGLSAATTYYYRVKSINDAGASELSTTVSVTTAQAAPSTPQNTAVDTATDVTITLSWDVVEAATGYVITRDIDSTGTFEVVDTTTDTSYTDTGLTQATTYYYKVASVNEAGASDATAILSATTATAKPAVAEGLTATPDSPTTINVGWNVAEGADSYTVLRSTDSAGTYDSVGTSESVSYTDSGLTAETTYYYKVTSVNEAGTSDASVVVSATTPAPPPDAPTGLSADTTAKGVSVQWESVDKADKYAVFRSASPGAEGDTVGVVTENSITDSTVAGATTYYYTVKSMSDAGVSEATEQVSVAVPLEEGKALLVLRPDNEVTELYIDGSLVELDTSNAGTPRVTVDIQGKQSLSIACAVYNSGWAGGLFGYLETRTDTFVTNGSWKYSFDQSAGWGDKSFNDNAWDTAAVLGDVNDMAGWHRNDLCVDPDSGTPTDTCPFYGSYARDARYIWTPSTLWFRKAFEAEAGTEAPLWIAVDGYYTAYLNGEELAANDTVYNPSSGAVLSKKYDVTLEASNVLAIKATGLAKLSQGVGTQLKAAIATSESEIDSFDLGDGTMFYDTQTVNTVILATDSTWKCTNKEETDWHTAGFDDSNWFSTGEYPGHSMVSGPTPIPMDVTAQWIWHNRTVYLRKEIQF